MEKYFPSAGRLLSAGLFFCFCLGLLERWPQVCRVKITLTKLPTNHFVSTANFLMKCVVNWIPLRICVRYRNTQHHLLTLLSPFSFFGFESTQVACQVQPERAQVETQYCGNPKVARLEGTPAIHVTCLYVSWYVRVVNTHSILKYYCLDLSWHERITAWLPHVGASQYYCVSQLSSRRSDGGLTMQMSCSKDKPNIRVVTNGDTPEVVG